MMLTKSPPRARPKRSPDRRATRPARSKPSGVKRRSSRIEARITPDNLAVIKRAAEIQGRSVSDFIATAAQEIAHRTIEETHIIRLTVAQHEQFMEALRNPPEPTPALRRAFERHSRLFGKPVA